MGGLVDDVAGAADHLAGSIDESVGRQFDDEEGGGFVDFSQSNGDQTDQDETGTTNNDSGADDSGGTFSEENFGDGSNEWIPGIQETIANPVDRATHPYDTVAGAADALTLNFDEGVGGLTSLVDGESGNTAGPGQEAVDPADTAGAAASAAEGAITNAVRTSPVLQAVVLLVALHVAGQLFDIQLGGGASA